MDNNVATASVTQGATKNRIMWLDIVKGICIIFVIMDHSYPPDAYLNFLTPFFLTMFFFASGYTFSLKGNFRKFFVGKVKHLLVPFLLLGAIRMIGMQVIGGGDLKEKIIEFFLQRKIPEGDLWFISCLFVTYLFMYVLVALTSKMKDEKTADIVMLVVSSFVAIIGLFILIVLNLEIPWHMEKAAVMLFYMVLGYLFKRYEFAIKTIPAILLFALYLVIIYFTRPTVWLACGAGSMTQSMLFVLASLVVVAPIIAVARALENCAIGKGFIFLGRNTLFYYAFSGIVREIIYVLIPALGNISPYISSLICTVTMTVVLIIPAWFVSRKMPWLIGQ